MSGPVSAPEVRAVTRALLDPTGLGARSPTGSGWNRVVDDTAYDWVTFHTFRKSVATLIDQTVDSKAAQAQLGHANEDITLEHYIHKAKIAPDLTDYLERFRPPTTPKT